jgi:hypothetical protein
MFIFQAAKASEVREGTSKKTGKPYKMHMASGMLKNGASVEVGELMLPFEHPKLEAGKSYEASVAVDGFGGRLGVRIDKLIPLKA